MRLLSNEIEQLKTFVSEDGAMWADAVLESQIQVLGILT